MSQYLDSVKIRKAVKEIFIAAAAKRIGSDGPYTEKIFKTMIKGAFEAAEVWVEADNELYDRQKSYGND